MNCTLCKQPVSWTVKVFDFIGNTAMLYHYGKLLGAETRFTPHNVWGCDRCKVAGGISVEDQDHVQA